MWNELPGAGYRCSTAGILGLYRSRRSYYVYPAELTRYVIWPTGPAYFPHRRLTGRGYTLVDRDRRDHYLSRWYLRSLT
jgi:hypothetical protein